MEEELIVVATLYGGGIKQFHDWSPTSLFLVRFSKQEDFNSRAKFLSKTGDGPSPGVRSVDWWPSLTEDSAPYA